MKTVKELIKELKKFPKDALCYAYEGETVGIGVKTKDNKKFGFIYMKEKGKDEKTEEFNEKN